MKSNADIYTAQEIAEHLAWLKCKASEDEEYKRKLNEFTKTKFISLDYPLPFKLKHQKMVW